MEPGKRIRRRQFMQDSMALLGAGSVAATSQSAQVPSAHGNSHTASDSAPWRLRATLDPPGRGPVLESNP